APGEILLQIDVRAPPRLRLRRREIIAGARAGEDPQIAEVSGLPGALSQQVIVARLHAEDISIWQAVGGFEAIVLVLKGDIEAPQITIVLCIGRLLDGVFDNAELEIGRARGRNAGEVTETILDNLIKAAHAEFPRRPAGGKA